MRFAAKILLVIAFLAGFQNTRAEWRRQSANTLAWLNTVYFLDASTGWIGGSKGVFLKTMDGGKTWIKQTPITRDTIRQVYFVDKKTGWILCERDIYNLGRNEASYFLKTENGGQTWDRIGIERTQRRRITKFFFSKSGFGLAVGETGALLGLQDDNRTWKRLALPSRYLMTDGVFLDEQRGAVVGGGGTILFTEDAGTTWNKAFVSEKSLGKLNAVFFNDTRFGWAVGSKGAILQTVNSGRIWRPQRSNTTEKLNGVFFLNTAEGWAIGDNGTILHTTTAGNIWRKIDSKSTHNLESIFFYGNRGWAVGFGGTILSYETALEPGTSRPRLQYTR
jgi:photosystem II stability/assembly factor-like uncharacterized protein